MCLDNFVQFNIYPFPHYTNSAIPQHPFLHYPNNKTIMGGWGDPRELRFNVYSFSIFAASFSISPFTPYSNPLIYRYWVGGLDMNRILILLLIIKILFFASMPFVHLPNNAFPHQLSNHYSNIPLIHFSNYTS